MRPDAQYGATYDERLLAQLEHAGGSLEIVLRCLFMIRVMSGSDRRRGGYVEHSPSSCETPVWTQYELQTLLADQGFALTALMQNRKSGLESRACRKKVVTETEAVLGVHAFPSIGSQRTRLFGAPRTS